VDKMGASYQGDPGSALLEVLDAEQNKDFLDHYLDVRCDLSEVLFIITANVLDTIPAPLRDRMDILRLSGYIMEEKVEIAKRYLIPKNRKAMGLKSQDVKFTDGAIKEIANSYAREAGVRNLENNIKKVLRKAAMDIVENEEAHPKSTTRPKAVVTVDNLEKYLGQAVFTTDRYYEKTPIGVCTGLAWTSLGGATLYIEAVKTKSDKTMMKLTGQAGDVMKESSQIAWTYLNSQIKRYAPGKNFFEGFEVHMHIPEGATPKDGPSAGVTMVTALLSLLLNKPVLQNLSMTGELTLKGKVLAIGGVKEKLIAARRSSIHHIIFPQDNKPDYDELPDYLKKGMKVYFVENYDEVYEIAFKRKLGSKEKNEQSAE